MANNPHTPNNYPFIDNANFTAVPHFMLEVIARSELPANTIRVLCWIMRKTWGWKKKTDFLPSWQIAKDTRLSEVAVSRALTTLSRYGIVKRRSRNITIELNWQSYLLPSVIKTLSKLSPTATLESNLPSMIMNEAKNKNIAKPEKLPSKITGVAVDEIGVAVDVNATSRDSNQIHIKKLNNLPGLPIDMTIEYALELENGKHGCAPAARALVRRALQKAREQGICPAATAASQKV